MRSQPKFPAPQPVPFTPIRGSKIVVVRFRAPELCALARRMRVKLNSRWAIIKPKRNSVGLLWRGRVFWWSAKGYYRNGKAGGDRRPFHHILWEHYHRRPMPPKHEIFFRDRDYHNFAKSNLELLSKAAMHKRIVEIGENLQPSLEFRQMVADVRWERHGRKTTGFLLDQFNRGGQTVAASLPKDKVNNR